MKVWLGRCLPILESLCQERVVKGEGCRASTESSVNKMMILAHRCFDMSTVWYDPFAGNTYEILLEQSCPLYLHKGKYKSARNNTGLLEQQVKPRKHHPEEHFTMKVISLAGRAKAWAGLMITQPRGNWGGMGSEGESGNTTVLVAKHHPAIHISPFWPPVSISAKGGYKFLPH